MGGNNRHGNDDLPSATLIKCLELIKNMNKIHFRIASSFYADYLQCLREMKRVSRRWIVIVIGNRVLSRTAINNGQITYEFANSLDLKLDDYYTRSIQKKRIKDLGGDGGGIHKNMYLYSENCSG